MLKKTLQSDDGPDPTEEIVTIATYQTVIEADLVREELEAGGIDAWVANATVAQTFVTMPETGVTIEVRAEDAEKALGIIDAISSAPEPSQEEIDAQIDASADEEGV
jgi:ABC-type amino acid transport substrate-binding protein